jgi:hypothetical protein
MMFRRLTFLGLFLFLIGAVVACGSAPTPTPEVIVVATAVPATDAIEVPTVEVPPAIVETAVVNEDPICNPTQSINLFSGPGLSFSALRGLGPNDTLTPLAFSPQGFPDGQWLEVEVVATNEQGWVGAGAAFVTCTVNPTSLPPAINIPPTPTIEPTETPEPQVLAQAGPPRITNNAPGGTKAEYVFDEVIVDDEFLFRIYIADTRFGNEDGAGINHADFTILTQDQSKIIYENREDQAAYCVFQGGLPNCNPWVEQNGRFFWPNGVAVESGSYHATILVYPQHPEFQDEVWNWDFDFWIDLP